jgi:uncharacterized membrane protein (UPF0127 family)
VNSSRAALGLAVFFFLSAAAACGAGKRGNPPLEKRELTIERALGGSGRVLAELARTGEERALGLMHRESLPDGQGMLFIFDRDEILSFWMKDTLIPLSIAFIGYDGRILEIRDMRPKDTASVRSRRSARYALEVPQGWFTRAGIAPGDRLQLDF